MTQQVNVEESLHYGFAMGAKQNFVAWVKPRRRRYFRRDAHLLWRNKLDLIRKRPAATGWTDDLTCHF